MTGALSLRRWIPWLVLAQAALMGYRYHVTKTLVAGDSAMVFMNLRSVIIDGDLDFANEFRHFYDDISPYTGNRRMAYVPEPDPRTGRTTNRMAVGAAVAWLPFFLLAHAGVLAARAAAPAFAQAADGYGAVYQLMAGLGSLVYGCLGVYLAYLVARRYFRREAALVAALTSWLATPLVYYMTIEPLMSHAVSFFAIALLLHSWLRARESDSPWDWSLVGLVGGFAAAVRFQDGLFLLIPFLDAARHGRRKLAILGALALSSIAAFSPQLAANRIEWGSFFVTGYRLDWVAPSRLPVKLLINLFDVHDGLVLLTPILGAALVGIWRFAKERERWIGGLLVLGFVVQWAFISSFENVFQAGSFGNRMLVNSTAIFVVGLAYLVDRAWASPAARRFWLGTCALSVAANGVHAMLYLLRVLPSP